MKQINFDVELLSTSPQRQFRRERVYTNDLNSVDFKFNILDLGLTGATAQILLYMQDGSFFQRVSTDLESGIVIGEKTITYTLKENEGNHAGLNKIQLIVVTAEGKHFASQKFEYETARGLEENVPKEIYIADIKAITDEAREYLVQMQSDFETAQYEKNTIFGESENQRALTFNNSQTTRDNAFTAEQTTRSNAFSTEQADRQTAFNASELARGNTFNASEADRLTEFNESQTTKQNAFNQSQTDRQAAYESAEAARDLAYGETVSQHLNSNMPHLFEDFKKGVKYRYGFQLSSDGIPQIISEEVI